MPALPAAREQNVALRPQRGVQAGGPDQKGGSLMSPKQFDADAALADVDETARHQSIAFKDLSIVLHTDFVVGTAFEIIEDDLGQAPLGEDAVVFDVDRFRGHGELRQNPSARVGTSIRVGDGERSAVVSACFSSSVVAALPPSTP